MENSKWSKYVVSDLRLPARFTRESKERYSQFATRILWMDDEIVPGATTQMNCSWYLKPTKGVTTSHTHEYDEIIGFLGSDPQNPRDLGGEIEFWIEDEQFILNRSTMVFAPRGVKHCPLIVKRVDRPILHFTTVNGGQYKVIPGEK